MKKTMFITSVIMVVVLAIALTTSSLAWFTAGGATSVSTTAIDIVAIDAQAAGAGLEISSYDANQSQLNWTTAAIPLGGNNLVTDNEDLAPMCPVVDYTSAQKVLTHAELYDGVNNMFEGKVTSRDVSGTMTPVFTGSIDDSGDETIYANMGPRDAFKSHFYIRNSGAANDITVSANVTAAFTDHEGAGTADQHAPLWIAVFDRGTDGNGKTLMKLFCLNGAGAGANDTNKTMTCAKTPAAFTDGQLRSAITGTNGVTVANGSPVTLERGVSNDAQGAAHLIEVYAWFDGDSLVNITRGSVGNISVTFSINS